MRKNKTGVLKRGLALLLAVLMTETVTADTELSYVRAQEAAVPQVEAGALENKESGDQDVLQGYRILSVGELAEETQMQTLPVGAEEMDIVFPDSLTVTAKEIPTAKEGNASETSDDNANSVSGDNVNSVSGNMGEDIAAEGETVELTLAGIAWKLDPAESDFPEFDGSQNGSVYTYTPVLPEADEEGTPLLLDETVELPVICVLVGEMQASLLSNGGELALDSLPIDNQWDVVINSKNLETYDNAVLTGAFSDFTDNGGTLRKSSWKGIVIDGVTANLTLKDVTIDRDKSVDDCFESTDAAITLRNGAVLNLTLEGGNYLEGATGGAGICVQEGTTLQITKESTGTLHAVGGNSYGGAAGIGANGTGWTINGTNDGTVQKLGRIVINGGTITADGGTQKQFGAVAMSAAGIGGSDLGTSGSIEINGGTVTATGGAGSAGIGGGSNGWVSSIVINGGTITAAAPGTDGARHDGAAIGAGEYWQRAAEISCGEIRISGGKVIAQGNIGYGNITTADGGTATKTGFVEIGENAALTCDGIIDPAPAGSAPTAYTLSITIYDGRISRAAKADLSLNGTTLAQSVEAAVSTPGTAVIKTKVMSGVLTGGQKIGIMLDGRTYEAVVDFQVGKTEYSETIGTALYPVTLEFYDPALTQDITVSAVEVKQGGKKLDAAGYYAPAQITKKKTHYGTMVLYLPAGIENTEISVTAQSLNQGKPMTKDRQSISDTEANTIRMREPDITLTAELLEVNQGKAKLRITSNYAGITLYYVEKNEGGTPTPEEVRKGESIQGFQDTSKEITVSCENTSEHHFYLAAELDGVLSGVADISFGTEPSVELVRQGETQGVLYDSLQKAIQDAADYPECTVKLLRNLTLTEKMILYPGTSLTIDLNGNSMEIKYSGANLVSGLFQIYSGASVIWKDSAGKGKVTGNITGKPLFCVYGTLVIQGGSFAREAGNIGGNDNYGIIRIEDGTFSNDVILGSRYDYAESLSGGTFYGTVKSVWGSTAATLKRGHRYRSLSDQSTSTGTTVTGGTVSNVEVIALTPIAGSLALSAAECKWEQKITAAYTPAAGETEEQYIYRWYVVEDGQERLSRTDGPITDRSSTYTVYKEDAGGEIYCEVEAEGTKYSGTITSAPAKVLTDDIGAKGTDGKDKLSIKINPKDFTGAPVTLTGSDIISCRYAGRYFQLSLGTDFEIIGDTYANNVQPSTADGKASVKIRGIGAYSGEYTVTFEIVEKDITAEAKVSPDDWTNQPVTVSAPEGYLICRKTEEGYDYEKGFAESFTVTEESTSPDGVTVTYRLKEVPAAEGTDGAVSAEKTVQVKRDHGIPHFGGEGDGITVEDNTWKRFLNKITFGTYTRTKDVTIKASDAVSGVAEYYYYADNVADKENYQILSTEQLDSYVQNGSFQKTADGKFSLSDKENQVVYAYAADRAGNRSSYICTEGLVLDTTAPVMKITEPAKENGTLKDTEATITVELEEDAAILFFYERKSFFENEYKYEQYVTAVNDYMMNSAPRYPQFLKNENGKQVPTVSENDSVAGSERFKYRFALVQLVENDKLELIQNAQRYVYRIEGKAGTNSIIIEDYPIGLDPDTNYTIWIAAVDSVGNITEQHFKFQTVRSMPKIETLPVVSGVYGDAAKELKVTQPGVAKYGDDEIKGTWKVTDTGTTVLPMDGSAKCQVTFTPEEYYGGKYESAVFEVTPALAKRPVEVVISSMGKTYGMQMPLLWKYAGIYRTTLNGTINELVTAEDAQSLKESLRWVTGATKDSPVGKYEYTVTSDSPKYEVTAVYYDNSTGKYDKSKGILNITQAQGELEKTADFKAGQAVQYQGGNQGAFRLGVKANHNEIPLHYEVTDAKDINGEVIAEENISSHLLTIAPDGTVTPKGAGTANITVSLPESSNYTAATETITVQVEIGKGDVRPVQMAGTLTYGEPLSSVDFSEAVFADASDSSVTVPGKITWKTPDVKPEAGSYEAEYTFKPYAASDPSWENNYNTYEGKVTVTVNKAKAAFENAPVPGDRIYNPKLALSKLLLNENAKVKSAVKGIDGMFIDGDWEFTDPKVEMTALQDIGVGTRSYEIHYVPNTNPSWDGDPDYEKNYDFSDTRITVQITVKKAVPYISVQPTVNAYTHGDYLYNQKLSVPEGAVIIGNGKGEPDSGSLDTTIPVPGTLTWKTPQAQLSHTESSGKEYEYVFTPDDTASFETVTGKIRITVNKAAYPPLMPGNTLKAAYTCTKISDVELPQGWEWKEADRETELEVGKTVTAEAIYQAADARNYENTSVSIRITRSECDHAKTEVRNARKATCIAEGHTGETWCLICKEKLSDGNVIPKDAENHVALTETVIRQATTSAEGVLLQECKPCGYRKEITIPKLPGENTDEPAGGSNGQQPGDQSGSHSGSQNEDQDTGSASGSSEPLADAAAATEPKVPFIRGEDGRKGWQVIEFRIDGATEGVTIPVDMNGTVAVPGEIFDSIRGRDVTVIFEMESGILWTVNGLDVTAQNAKDINFGVTMGKQAGRSIPVDVINNITGERYSVNLTLMHNGEFGFTATLTINMEAVNAGLYANLFYYNPENGELEFMCAGKIDENGNTELTFSHASDYTVVIDTEPMDGSVQDNETGEEPGTEQSGSDDAGAGKETPAQAADPFGQAVNEAADSNSGQSFGNGGIRILAGAVILIAITALGAVYVLLCRKEDQ